ncbi:helix-turn-helix domain-containing protein [Thermus sp. PS18]|uniref:helix-turn-helix domain-containing protein n=1 Tax=Thermus sp. PS18 TaxID=2849039 RepID=UPI0022651D71|nr:helix-turn-helix domain-containing protein [Thermus sp. PS18]UZX15688.1 helix-turn-helix domain-containing protein [Thermus sp. PS18]
MPLPEKPLFTVKEAAEYLGLPEAQVYQLCRARVWPRLACIRLGKRIYIPRKAVERWLEAVAEEDGQSAQGEAWALGTGKKRLGQGGGER